MVMMKNYKNKA